MKFETFTIPKSHKEIFMKPEYEKIAGLIALNKRRFQSYRFDINGNPYSQFREWVRKETLKIARGYSERMRSLFTKTEIANDENLSSPYGTYNAETAIIQTGHAPILVHPGILIKYSLVSKLAKQIKGIGLNLIVDSEVCRDHLLSVPHIHGSQSTLERVPYIPNTDNIAFEEMRHVDLNQLKELKKRSMLSIHNAEMRHTFSEFMDILIKLHNEIQNIRDLFTFSRHAYTQRFDINNLELPLSLLCKTEPFYEFLLHIAQKIIPFSDIYNSSLNRYRKQRKIRSKANPLPNLEREGDTIELPFWIWGKSSPRERLFASLGTENRMRLLYRKEIMAELNFSASGNSSENLGKLKSICVAGLKIRPRAIINTLFARMFVSDLFVHGIGGAKYDQLTDEIIEKFYRIEPPSYATISATLHLPFDQYHVSQKDVEGLRDLIKDMNSHPENYSTNEAISAPSIQSLVSEKRKLILTEMRNRDDKRRAYKRLKELNILMKEKISPLIVEKKKELVSLEEKLRYNSIVTMREYPFCIYPEKILRGLFSFVSRT